MQTLPVVIVHRLVNVLLLLSWTLLAPCGDEVVIVSFLCVCSEYYHYRQSWIPLRWLPSEAVFEDDFSTKTDVWSFGVLMWEVFSFGELPYAELTDDKVLEGAPLQKKSSGLHIDWRLWFVSNSLYLCLYSSAGREAEVVSSSGVSVSGLQADGALLGRQPQRQTVFQRYLHRPQRSALWK